jgi:ribosomal protein L16 Arg81 hydroxylase
MAPQSDSTVLADLIAPTSLDEFLRRDWDRAPLLVRGAREHGLLDGADRWSHLFSEDALDQLVSQGGLAAPAVRLARGDEVVLRESWGISRLSWGTGAVAGFARPERVFDLMAAGFSLTLDGVDRLWGPLGALCAELRGLLMADLQCAVHRAPAEDAEGSPRYDVGHRFILQIGGCRRWQVFAPHQDRPQRLEACPAEGVTPGESVLEARLQAGDLLYVPRGFVVQQAGVSDASSLAVQLSVKPLTWSDLALAVAGRLDEGEGGAAVRVNSRKGVSLTEPQVDWLDEQVEELLMQHDVDAAFAGLVGPGPAALLPLSAGLARSEDDTESPQ